MKIECILLLTFFSTFPIPFIENFSLFFVFAFLFLYSLKFLIFLINVVIRVNLFYFCFLLPFSKHHSSKFGIKSLSLYSFSNKIVHNFFLLLITITWFTFQSLRLANLNLFNLWTSMVSSNNIFEEFLGPLITC